MTTTKNVQLMITLPKLYRDCLRKLAAEQNLRNPDQIITPAGLGKEILCAHLDELMQEKTDGE